MIQSTGCLSFTPEAGEIVIRLRSGEQLADERLQCDAAIDDRVVALVNDAHAAAPHFAPNLVFTEVWRQTLRGGAHGEVFNRPARL